MEQLEGTFAAPVASFEGIFKRGMLEKRAWCSDHYYYMEGRRLLSCRLGSIVFRVAVSALHLTPNVGSMS